MHIRMPSTITNKTTEGNRVQTSIRQLPPDTNTCVSTVSNVFDICVLLHPCVSSISMCFICVHHLCVSCQTVSVRLWRVLQTWEIKQCNTMINRWCLHNAVCFIVWVGMGQPNQKMQRLLQTKTLHHGHWATNAYNPHTCKYMVLLRNLSESFMFIDTPIRKLHVHSYCFQRAAKWESVSTSGARVITPQQIMAASAGKEISMCDSQK
jgi:hypothetical protein